jgi:hypothetical protein
MIKEGNTVVLIDNSGNRKVITIKQKYQSST